MVKKKQKHSSSNLRESVASGNNDTQVFNINYETKPSSRFFFLNRPQLVINGPDDRICFRDTVSEGWSNSRIHTWNVLLHYKGLMESGLCKGMLLVFFFFGNCGTEAVWNIHTHPKDRQQFGFCIVLNEWDSVEVLLTGLEHLYIGMN